jgi:hypothetical protein
MSGSSQFVSEGDEPRRLALRVVEQQHLSHLASRNLPRGARGRTDPRFTAS